MNGQNPQKLKPHCFHCNQPLTEHEWGQEICAYCGESVRCQHTSLEYAGEQTDRFGKKVFDLYNCRECGSTITKEEE